MFADFDWNTDRNLFDWAFGGHIDLNSGHVSVSGGPKPDADCITAGSPNKVLFGRLQAENGDAASISQQVLSVLPEDPGAATRVLETAVDYSLVFVDAASGKALLLRSFSGAEPLYYWKHKADLYVSSHHSWIRRQAGNLDFDPVAALGYLSGEFVWEPDTLYVGVRAAPRAAALEVTVDSEQIVADSRFTLNQVPEATGSKADLARSLRQHIVRAVKARLRGNSGLYLSGGIDSCVLAATLRNDLGIDDVQCLSFSVTGLGTSEAGIASLAAQHFGFPHEVLVLDPHSPLDIDGIIPSVNSTELGMFVVSALAARSASVPRTVFAGQDTRLHTPYFLPADELFFSRFARSPILSATAIQAARGLASVLSPRSTKYGKALRLLADSKVVEDVVMRRYLKRATDYQLVQTAALQLADEQRQEVVRRKVLAEGMSIHDRFRAIVDIAWGGQYVFDMHYMKEATALGGQRCALPFYDRHLAEFSAALPYALTSGFVEGRAGHKLSEHKKVNKAFLRSAYEGDLPTDLLLRDKAVAPTLHLFMNHALDPYILRVLDQGGVWSSSVGRYLDRDAIERIVRSKRANWEAKDVHLGAQILRLVWLDTIARSHS